MALKIGDPAPDFTLPDQDGKPFTLSAKRGERLLLVFYPGDNTPVCTRQLCEYRDGIEEFAELDANVIGISRDNAESHRKFRARHALPFILLSDSDLEVAERYGCRGALGMKRAVFLVDAEGAIRYAHIEALSLFRRRKDELLAVLAAK